MQSAAFGKRLMTQSAVHRNAEHLGFVLVKLRKHLVVECHLITAERTPIRRIEARTTGLPARSLRQHVLIGSDTKREPWSHCTGRQHLQHPSHLPSFFTRHVPRFRYGNYGAVSS